MKSIKLARNSGFCFGVKRAIKLAEETASSFKKAVTLGPIIHNPQMVENLKNKGVIVIEKIDEIKDEAVIIRSHGIPKETLELLKTKELPIIDATCPYVAKAHEYAKIADNENYDIVILGNNEHPEVIALKSYINRNVFFSESDFEAPNKKLNKVAVICQTTQNIENLKSLTREILPLCTELRVFNTICNATNVRQQSSLELAKKCDLMIVIGGKNSSNTKMLAKLCSQYAKTMHIETADEIMEDWFTNTECIGLTAGASTPDWIIIEVYNKIKVIVGEACDLVQTVEAIPGYKEESNEY